MTERILVVHNTKSTRAKQVKEGVFDRLDDAGVDYVPIQTISPNFKDNVDYLCEQIRDGDTVVSAAGDGTGSQIQNAILAGGKDSVRLGFLGYGNFNDLAHAYNGHRMGRDVMALISEDASLVDVYPLDISVNGSHWRFAPGYATAGWTAKAASGFGDVAFREKMKNMPEALKLAASMGHLALDYFQNRNRYLQKFHTSESPVVRRAVTDVIALNNPVMARLLCLARRPYIGDEFAYKELDVSSVLKNVPYLMSTVLGGDMPSRSTDGVELIFEQPSVVPIQTEGEFAELSNVRSIHFGKSKSSVSVIHPNRSENAT